MLGFYSQELKWIKRTDSKARVPCYLCRLIEYFSQRTLLVSHFVCMLSIWNGGKGVADLDSRCDCSLGRRYTVCMGRVPLLRQLCCSQPCSIPAGACTGRVWALWCSELLHLSLGHHAVPSLVPYNLQVYAKGEYGLYRATHCYLFFGHQSVPSLVPQNQQVYAKGGCGLHRAMPILRAPNC